MSPPRIRSSGNRKEDALLTVSVTRPKVTTESQSLTLPGNTQAFKEAPIYARTSGYLKRWYADIGTRVHSGELLAEIETPEVDQQLQQARADLQTAQANLALSKTTAARWQDMLKTNSVSQQETDEKVGDLAAKKAIADSAAANVRRLENLQSYEKIYAPFDGVVTARNTDVGGIDWRGREHGTGTLPCGGHRSTASLRQCAGRIRTGREIRRESGAHSRTNFRGRNFIGTVVRNANAIDPTSRTLLVEIDVNNPSGELLPGAYTMVHRKQEATPLALSIIPANTLLFRSEGLRVAVVRDEKAVLTPIQVGRDFGEKLEITAGLKPDDELIVNPPDSIVTGAPLRVTRGND